MVEQMDECFLTTKEYADLVGVSRRTVQRWLQQGLIFGVTIGRGIKIPCDEPSPQTFDVDPEPEPVFEEEVPEYRPEPIVPPEEDFESEFPFEVADTSGMDSKDLRRWLSSFMAAVNYARDIPLEPEDLTIIFDPTINLFRVRVDYETVKDEP